VFDSFTEQGRNVVVVAREEAQGLGHRFLAGEHLLLGLLADQHSTSAQILTARGLHLDEARRQIGAALGTGHSTGETPLTDQARTVLLGASLAAQRSGSAVSSEHVLHALSRNASRLVSQMLANPTQEEGSG
jgi:ATP-dependent Clp protease ATP-binding subunit ClpC